MNRRKDMILKDKVAIVTGSGRGIGKGIAQVLAQKGAKVISTDINKELAVKTSNEINKRGGISKGFKLNVTNVQEIKRVLKKIVNEFSRVDILVNNAGINIPTPILKMSEKVWDKVIEVNLKGVFLCSQAVAKIMVKQQFGKIINISSVAGKISAPGAGPYCASKRGVIGLTEVLAIELGKYGICVNAICPGNTETEMVLNVFRKRAQKRGQSLEELMQGIKDKTPLGRFGKPQDIAKAVVFLASDYSNYITGQAINVCGGRSINLS